MGMSRRPDKLTAIEDDLLEDGMHSLGWGFSGGMPCQHYWPRPPLQPHPLKSQNRQVRDPDRLMTMP